MILLHFAVAALYAAAAWASWPRADARPRRPARATGCCRWRSRCTRTPSRPRDRHAGRPRPLVRQRAVAGRRPRGARRVGVRTAAHAAGRRRPSSCRLPRVCALAPAAGESPHRFAYAGEPWAAVHIAVALLAYALFVVAALQALVLIGLEARLRRGLARGCRRRRAAAAAARALHVPPGRRGLRAAHGDADQRPRLFRGDLRTPAHVHAQERLLGRRVADVRGAAVRALALRLARTAARCAGSSRERCCSSWATSAASSCPKCCCAADSR